MPGDERRTAEVIREEMRAEREQLDSALAVLESDARRTGRIAGSALAAVGGVILLMRLRSRHRGR